MDWENAKKYCKKQGGHLVTITSKEEQSTVSSLVSRGSKNFYWLGAERDYDRDDFYSWITGEPIGYTNYDIENIYIDGLFNIINCTMKESAQLIKRIANLTDRFGINVYINININGSEEVPEGIKEYVA